jgi:hypothetical protein
MTYSFGSIAEGSLIVALLDLLRAALSLLQQQESQSGDIVGAALACVAQCCVGCIRWMVDYFSAYYSFSFIIIVWRLVNATMQV